MSNPSVQAVAQERTSPLSRQVAVVVGASLLMAICGRLSMPLPFTPVYLTMANFGVLLIALTLGSRRAAAAMLLYLAEGAMGLPVFSPAGPGGIAQLLGPTGGYLVAYPIVAFVTGWLSEHGQRSVVRFSLAAIAGEILLFASGVSWLVVGYHATLVQATNWGIYPFAFAEVIKVMSAVAGSVRLNRSSKFSGFIA